ncbi:hypothetical protein SAMN02745244_03657 [Tessaracoccus bendigoensis DSM 12906]|uniref:Uncharacterized protein n=2 Tax=Tessaracoccus TaxID=72763 RepID=A0A1M6NJL3_9ACTN|nr:hypothetical protein SAMN02745244_03657 [Tessaracoccus bendigoensis DSM 12906]
MPGRRTPLGAWPLVAANLGARGYHCRKRRSTALESDQTAVTPQAGRFLSSPPLTILGMEAGFEAGIRQLRRRRPLEVISLKLPSGAELRVPTEAEILRIKCYLIVNRNRTRDYLDVAALADHLGITRAQEVVGQIGDYYGELTSTDGAVSTVLADRLFRCEPVDRKAIATLSRFKGLDVKWADWGNVATVCRELAKGVLR